MNRRIRPDDLEISPYKERVQALAFQWVRAELPAGGLSYADYIRDISTLLLTTQHVDQTTAVVQAVLTQAAVLHKTSGWVEQELNFEGMIHGTDRADFLRPDLQQSGQLDDPALDRYNERLNRFK